MNSRSPLRRRAVVCAVLLVVGAAAGCQPQVPSDDCRQYVRCQAAYDAAAGLDPVDTADFEKDGSCWTSPEFSEACTEECVEAVAVLRDAAALGDLRVEECDAADADDGATG